MMRRGTAQRDSTEEMIDEASLTMELTKLQRKLRVMEGDRRSYAEESCNILRKQESEIEALLKENREIRIVLRLAKSDTNECKDTQDTLRLLDLIDSMDLYNTQAELEQKRINELDEQIKMMEHKVTKYEKKKCGNTEVMSEMAIQKTIRVMENRLHKAMVKFNDQLSVNARLRQEIDHLRQERNMFDNLYKKLTKDLADTKRRMNDVISEASHAYEERDEAQTKMIALKERSEKDISQFEIEMKDLRRILEHDNKLKEFMMFKSYDRADFKDEEEAKKKKNSGDKDCDAEKEEIKTYEEAFQRIKEATKKNDIGVIVSEFIKVEDENFALFNYVNELNDEVEHLNEIISMMQKEIEAFETEDISVEEERKQMMKDLEDKLNRISQVKEDAEKRTLEINKVLDELRSGVAILFQAISCDPSAIYDMLGCDNGVSNKNILLFMGIIEQKTMEMLQTQQYLQMKRNPPKPEKKEKKGEPTPPTTQQFQKINLPPPVNIGPLPTTGEDEDAYDVADDSEHRPLTQNELRNVVMRKITRKTTGQRLTIQTPLRGSKSSR